MFLVRAGSMIWIYPGLKPRAESCHPFGIRMKPPYGTPLVPDLITHRHPLFPLPPVTPGDIVSLVAWRFARSRELIFVARSGMAARDPTGHNPMLNPKRTIAELKELRALTGDENGAQRVAFTETWGRARAWLREKLQSLPLEVHSDPAGNVWATLSGKSERSLLIGGHIDSVPNGGWLDGCLNLLAGVEILRRINDQYGDQPPVTVRLVDWADEEGARFGKSLFGSSACSGKLDLDEARGLVDRDGVRLPDALKNVGIDLERAKGSGGELKSAAAYIELHIEQGPVLLDLDLPLGAVLGTFGVERHAITFHGQAAHSGSTPMNVRKDAFLAAAKMSPEIYRITQSHGGVCTIGSSTTNA